MQKINELRLLYITDQQLHSVSCYALQCVDTFMYHALVIVAGSRGGGCRHGDQPNRSGRVSHGYRY